MTNKIPVKTYVDKDVYSFLKKLAKQQRCSVAQVMRTLLVEAMNERCKN
jgi:hypothetical protein